MPALPCCLRPLPLLPHLVLPFGSAQHLQVCVEASGLALVAEALPFPRCLGAIPQTSIEFAPAPSDVLLETVSGERRCELPCYSHLENTTGNHQQLESKSGSSTQIEEVRVSGEVPRYTCEVLRNCSGTRGRCWHGAAGVQATPRCSQIETGLRHPL